MHRAVRIRTRPSALVILLAALTGSVTARADALSAAQVLRAGGCGGILPAAPPLQRNHLLDRVARDWAAGTALSVAAERSGYRAPAMVGVRLNAGQGSLLQGMRRTECRRVMEPALREAGLYHVGGESWLVMMRAGVPGPDMPPAPALAIRALELINAARARGTRCGKRAFAPAPPVALSGTLGGVAFGHATDMARHGYFEHQDLGGRSPADRVRAAGYREKLVGENIAYGPQTVDEVVQGWLDSSEHCENIMDPRFAQMGIASAAGHTARRGLYWVQVLAEPRA